MYGPVLKEKLSQKCVIVPNLYTFLSYDEHQIRYFEESNICGPPMTCIVCVGGYILSITIKSNIN